MSPAGRHCNGVAMTLQIFVQSAVQEDDASLALEHLRRSSRPHATSSSPRVELVGLALKAPTSGMSEPNKRGLKPASSRDAGYRVLGDVRFGRSSVTLETPLYTIVARQPGTLTTSNVDVEVPLGSGSASRRRTTWGVRVCGTRRRIPRLCQPRPGRAEGRVPRGPGFA